MFENGYQVLQVPHLDTLQEAREMVAHSMSKILARKVSGSDLSNFHKFFDKSNLTINELRLALIAALNKADFTAIILSCYSKVINEVLGPDFLSQRSVNLVIQVPNDPEPSEVHRDFPANSAWELVVWLPFVDCTGTRSMFVCDVEQSLTLTHFRKSNPGISWNAFNELVRSKAKTVSVKFGEILLFQTPLYHGSNINRTSKTRISVNQRYRALFAPAGMKDELQFFKLVSESQFSKNASLFHIAEEGR